MSQDRTVTASPSLRGVGMGQLLHLGDMLSTHARLRPEKVAARDSSRSLTFRQWNARANRLANALLGLGLQKGDRVSILAYDCIEWMEFYVALAKAGLVAVPINFRLTPPEMRYIIEDAGASALIAQHDLVGSVEEIRVHLALDEALHPFRVRAVPRGL